jgi:hypothetical protein
MRIAIGSLLHRGAAMLVAVAIATTALASEYPPPGVSASGKHQAINPPHTQALLFTNTHFYGNVTIKVEVFDNYLGDFTKYHWVYTVTNNSFEPNPGVSNGFSGFELTLPVAVPDIGDIAAPDGIGPWIVNGFSGLPVEWDLRNTDGAPVAGGTLIGQTEKYSFTTLPRLVTLSTGWFHTWETDVQTNIINYPPNDGPEVPDVLAPPNQELCCYQDATGAYICQVLPAGQCTAIGGNVVPNCTVCPPVVPVTPGTWGGMKGLFR